MYYSREGFPGGKGGKVRFSDGQKYVVVVIVIILNMGFGSIGENWSCVRVPFSALSEIDLAIVHWF